MLGSAQNARLQTQAPQGFAKAVVRLILYRLSYRHSRRKTRYIFSNLQHHQIQQAGWLLRQWYWVSYPLVVSCFGVVGIICGILAVIFGGCALLTKKGGKGMAIAGLVCGIIALIPSIIVISTVGSIVDALG